MGGLEPPACVNLLLEGAYCVTSGGGIRGVAGLSACCHPGCVLPVVGVIGVLGGGPVAGPAVSVTAGVVPLALPVDADSVPALAAIVSALSVTTVACALLSVLPSTVTGSLEPVAAPGASDDAFVSGALVSLIGGVASRRS